MFRSKLLSNLLLQRTYFTVVTTGQQAVKARCIRCFASDTSATPEKKLIANLLENNEQIAYYGENIVQQAYNVLLKAGFSPENSVKVIDKHPNLLRCNPKQIEERLEMWHMAQFSQSQYYELFVQCPELLDFDDEHYLAKRYAQLQTIVHTPKNIWRLLMSCPNLLVDDMRTIQQKVDYILKSMEADVTDIVKSGSLGLSLKTIKSRHTLLVRLGIYKKRNWRASELDPNKNLRLFRIMDLNDEEFAIKTCRISMKEFEAFNELYERELEEQIKEQEDYEEEDTDSGEESDSDDNNFDPRERKDYYDDRNRRRYKKK
ncbi:transcription termination factor 4, mitochondrial [Sitodiplosis mosellana]|uniref:transcription termination factor 4, mitochondrial n=1 Tax=Sitodiplosis mosellana TaxID=263140 RepID=UPI002443F970|nr:transcription termination factor 4, mitochondrial [Sitodiplosis mosellana]